MQPIDLSSLGGRVYLVRLYLAPAFGRAVDRVCFAEAVAAYRGSGTTVPHETTVKGWEEGARPNDATVEAIAGLAQAVGLSWATREWITYCTGADPPILPPIQIEAASTVERPRRVAERKATPEPPGASKPVSSKDYAKRKKGGGGAA